MATTRPKIENQILAGSINVEGVPLSPLLYGDVDAAPLSQMETTRSPCDTSVHFTLTGTPQQRHNNNNNSKTFSAVLREEACGGGGRI